MGPTRTNKFLGATLAVIQKFPRTAVSPAMLRGGNLNNEFPKMEGHETGRATAGKSAVSRRGGALVPGARKMAKLPEKSGLLIVNGG